MRDFRLRHGPARDASWCGRRIGSQRGWQDWGVARGRRYERYLSVDAGPARKASVVRDAISCICMSGV